MPSPLFDNWALDPAVTYLNHGSFGACPRPVLEAQARERDRLEAGPVRYLARELEARLDEVRAELSAFLAAEPADLVFLPNATSAVNAVLGSLPLERGDALLTTDHAYNACGNVLRHAAERVGAELVVARVPFPLEDPGQVVEAVRAASRPRTRLALIDHVTSPTALVFPVRALVRELEDRGVPVLVDGAHAPGMVPLDLASLGASYYTGNCHKWLCAPKGAAFLHVRRDLQPSVRPAIISHARNSSRTDRPRFLQEFDWTGTFDPTAVLSVPAALRFVAALLPGGWPEAMARNRRLALQGRALLAATLDSPPPAPETMVGSMASLLLPGEGAPSGPDPLEDRLVTHHRIEVPVIPWPAPSVARAPGPARRRLLRFSAQLYLGEEDFARLAAALAQELARGSERG